MPRTLLSSLDRLLGHVDQSILRLAVGEVGDRSDSPLGVILRKGPCLLDAVALQHQLTSLVISCQHNVQAVAQARRSKDQESQGRSSCVTHSGYITLLLELPAHKSSQLGVVLPGKQQWRGCQAQFEISAGRLAQA